MIVLSKIKKVLFPDPENEIQSTSTTNKRTRRAKRQTPSTEESCLSSQENKDDEEDEACGRRISTRQSAKKKLEGQRKQTRKGRMATVGSVLMNLDNQPSKTQKQSRRL